MRRISLRVTIITKFPDRSELGYRLEVEAFFAALREGRTPTAGPEDAPWRSYGWHWSGRPPKDKRVVEDENSRAEVWWGPVNIPIEPNTLVISRERARGYLNTRDRLYCVDELRVGIRSIASMCASSVHGHNIVFQWGRLIPAYCKLCD